MFKKLLLSFLASLVLFQSFAFKSPVLAQSSSHWYDSDILTWFTKVYSTDVSQPQEIFGERYTAAQVQWVVYSLITLPINLVFSSEFTACILTEMKTGGFLPRCYTLEVFLNVIKKYLTLLRSFVPIVQIDNSEQYATTPLAKPRMLLSMVFADKNLSGVTYFKNIASKITLVPEVRAQEGFGYGALDILQPLWQQSRDISYGLLVLVVIIMAFMVMFRTKVSPQAVITVQSALPKLIFAIILITFSYAIAGLLIDIMYVVVGIVASVLGKGNTEATARLYSLMINGPGGGGIWTMMTEYTSLFPAYLAASVGNDLSPVYQFIFDLAIGPMIIVGGLLIVGFILLGAFFRSALMIIKSLISIYLLTIFGPFYILFGTVFSGLSFGNWIKDFAANLAVFPAMGILFVFSMMFMNAGLAASGFEDFPQDFKNYIIEINQLKGLPPVADFTGADSWTPPLLSFGGSNGALILLFVSLGIIIMIPRVAEIIKGFVSGRPFAYGTAIGEAFGPIVGVGRGLGMGAIGAGSAMEAAKWQAGARGPAMNVIHGIASAIRQMSGGRIK